MKTYIVIDSNNYGEINNYGNDYEVYSFKNLNDAQEFVLSCVEQESVNTYNYLISIYTEERVLTEWKKLASKYSKTLEGYLLYRGGYNLNGIYESELN